jgi:hypothetical protein
MGWPETLKELLASVSTMLRDIPVWAKTIICLLVFAVVTYIVAANAQQMFVFQLDVAEKPESDEGIRYTILHTKSGYQTPYESSGTEVERATIPVRVGLLESLGREFSIVRRTATSGQGAHRVVFTFDGSRPIQSDVITVSVVCDFAAKPHCSSAGSGSVSDQKSSRLRLPTPRAAYAAEPPAAHLNVPTLETLRDLQPDGGYMEVRVTNLRLDKTACGRDCSGAVFWRVEWNGVTFFFDGIPPDATRNGDIAVSRDGSFARGIAFGIENTLFRDGANTLQVTLYTRRPLGGGFRPFEQLSSTEPKPLDAIESGLEVLRKVSLPVKGRGQQVSGELHVKPIAGALGRNRELFIGAGTQTDVTTMREFVNDTLGKRVTLGGKRLLGVLRPPLKANPLWGLAVGVVEPKTDKVRLLLSEAEAKSLLADLRRLPDQELRPLKRDNFFIQEVASRE